MNECEICGAETDSKILLVLGRQTIAVCKGCLGDYTSHNYNGLIAKLDRKKV